MILCAELGQTKSLRHFLETFPVKTAAIIIEVEVHALIDSRYDADIPRL